MTKGALTPIRKSVIALTMVGSTLAGGALGAALFTGFGKRRHHYSDRGGRRHAQRDVHANEMAAHEATGRAVREAQENAGQVPAIP